MPKINVSESIVINATPEEVFDCVADFGQWTKWSPWLCTEPDATVIVSDDSNSVGSKYTWQGELVGEGSIEHVAMERAEYIREDLRFLKPWKSQASVRFEFKPVGEGTQVTWVMDSSLPFFMFWMKGTMESVIGMDYDRGLRMLKEYIESGEVKSSTRIRGTEDIGPLYVAGERHSCTMDTVGEVMESAIAVSGDVLSKNNVCVEADKIAVYHDFDMKTRTFRFTAGHIVKEPVDESLGLATWSMPAARAVAVEHVGSYENLGNPWSAGYQYVRYKKLKQSNVGTFEIYRNSPVDTAPADLHTDIYLPLK